MTALLPAAPPHVAPTGPGLTVATALDMAALRSGDPVVVAGRAGLGRLVHWVHTTELADVGPLLRGGDLVLSTGIALPESCTDLELFVRGLEASDAAGLVIELGRRWTIVPPALVDMCDELALPLVALRREVRFAAVAQAVGERLVHGQLTELRAVQRVHDAFTDLSLAEAGPDQVLDAVLQLVGCTVVLEDAHHRLLDYRLGPGDTATHLADWHSRSRACPLEARTTWDPAAGWLLTRVGRADRAWGRLVLHSPQQPAACAVAALERAAAALTVHSLHDRRRDSMVRRTHAELLAGLSVDPTAPDLVRRCELIGVPLTRRTLVGVTARPVARAGGDPLRADDVATVLAALVHAAAEERVPALVAVLDGQVRALLSIDPGADADPVVDALAARVLRRHDVVVGAGQVTSSAGGVARTLGESQHVVDSLGPAPTGSGVHRMQDVHLRGLLSMLAEDDRLLHFVSRELDPLREHDARWGTCLLDAVRALVRYPGSKSEAAASLHVSRPAFYDRLAKVERVLGVHLDDPDIRVSLHTAVVADEVLGRQASSKNRMQTLPSSPRAMPTNTDRVSQAWTAASVWNRGEVR
ncbi:purine catabolism regulatory protein [Klenkia soli]|uniref:Purine catabolism regulatory protein n=1 Tax=Klenkia soli TaxID=1052260 RepID=A0A1H0FWG4_9ACTN|nr:purine catabolism regulatory protein [Klenkia soli]